jgi:hypothetical protein
MTDIKAKQVPFCGIFKIDDGRKNTIQRQLVSVLSPIGIHVEQYWKDNLIEVHPENFC